MSASPSSPVVLLVAAPFPKRNKNKEHQQEVKAAGDGTEKAIAYAFNCMCSQETETGQNTHASMCASCASSSSQQHVGSDNIVAAAGNVSGGS